MKAPCEIVVWYVIPAIMSELAKELLNLGMKQKDVSEIMNITQPAVSQYITGKRGSGVKTASIIEGAVGFSYLRHPDQLQTAMIESHDYAPFLMLINSSISSKSHCLPCVCKGS